LLRGCGKRASSPRSVEHGVTEEQPRVADRFALSGSTICSEARKVDFQPFCLFRRHVLDSADDGADRRGIRREFRERPAKNGRTWPPIGPRAPRRRFLGRARNPKIHDQRIVVPVDHDVGRFEIAVHHVGGVSGHQPRHERPYDPQCPGRRNLPFSSDESGEVNALDLIDGASARSRIGASAAMPASGRARAETGGGVSPWLHQRRTQGIGPQNSRSLCRTAGKSS
jgi:hypothetical protein